MRSLAFRTNIPFHLRSLLFAVFAWRFYTKLANQRLRVLRDNLQRHIDNPSDFETGVPSKKLSTSSSVYPRKYFPSDVSSLDDRQSPEFRMPVIEEVFESSRSDDSSGYRRRDDVFEYHDEFGGYNI